MTRTLTTTTTVDCVAAVDPYDAARPDWVTVGVEDGPHGRFVRLVEPGGKVAFRVPAANSAALAVAIVDAANGDVDGDGSEWSGGRVA